MLTLTYNQLLEITTTNIEEKDDLKEFSFKDNFH